MPDMWMDVDAGITVPANLLPLLDPTDFKTIEDNTIAYNAAGIEVIWHFVTTAGAQTATPITPTTGGNYDWTHSDGGCYKIEIPASGGVSANNDTEGFGWITGKADACLPFRGPVIGFRRVALNDLFIDGGTASTNLEDFFDGTGYAGGTAKLGVDIISISGDTTAADNAELMFDGTGYAGGTIKLGANLVQILGTALTETAGQIAAAFKKFFDVATPTGTVDSLPDAIPGAAGGLFIAGTNAATSITTALTANITGNLTGSVGSVTGAVGSVTGAVGSVSGNVTGSIGSLATQAKADVNAEVDTALSDVRLDELLSADSDIDGVAPPTVGSVFHELLTKTAGSFTYDQTTDSLEALRDNLATAAALGSPSNLGSGATIAANLVDIEGQTDDIGIAGAGLTAIPWNAAWDTEVESEANDALVALNLDHVAGTATGIPAIPAGTYLDQMMDDGTAVYDRTTDSLQAIRDRGDSAWTTATLTAQNVWEYATRTLTAFAFSVTVGTNNDKTGYALSAAGVQAIWDALTAALTTVNSIGKLLVDNINATVGSRSSHSAADVWSVVARTLTAGTNIVLAKGVGVTGFNDLSAAQVNAEVVDALATDTYAQPGQEAPAATTTLASMIRYLYKGLRNRYTQTATEFKLYADDAVTVDQKASVSDDGVTFDRSEIGTGP